MVSLHQLRIAAREIFAEALRAVDASEAVRKSLRLENSTLTIQNSKIGVAGRRIYSIAIGKAAVPMAQALEEVLGDKLVAGVIAGT